MIINKGKLEIAPGTSLSKGNDVTPAPCGNIKMKIDEI